MLSKALAMATTLVLLASLPAAVMGDGGPPSPPHVFAGLASVAGTPAAEGTLVSAHSGGVVLAQASLSQGRYLLVVPQPAQGQTVSFTVDGLPADQTASWARGGADMLDLSASGRSTSDDSHHLFAGQALVDGLPPAEGTTITAYSDAQALASAKVAQGRYLLHVPRPSNGHTISFALGDFPVGQTAQWSPGGASLLDLTTQMSRTPVYTVLDTLDGNLVRIFHRDPHSGVWTYFDSTVNPQDLDRFFLAPGQEYWLKLKRDQVLAHHQRESSLRAGWNIVVW